MHALQRCQGTCIMSLSTLRAGCGVCRAEVQHARVSETLYRKRIGPGAIPRAAPFLRPLVLPVFLSKNKPKPSDTSPGGPGGAAIAPPVAKKKIGEEKNSLFKTALSESHLNIPDPLQTHSKSKGISLSMPHPLPSMAPQAPVLGAQQWVYLIVFMFESSFELLSSSCIHCTSYKCNL